MFEGDIPLWPYQLDRMVALLCSSVVRGPFDLQRHLITGDESTFHGEIEEQNMFIQECD